jgi:hypothetical protein
MPGALWAEVIAVAPPLALDVRFLDGSRGRVTIPAAVVDPACCNRDGALGLEHFRRGDEIVLALRGGNRHVADRVDICFRAWTGTLLGVTATLVQTSAGDAAFPADALVRSQGTNLRKLSRAALRPGQLVGVTARWDAPTTSHVARLVTILS